MNKRRFLKWYDKETKHFINEKKKNKKTYNVNFKGVQLSIMSSVWDPSWGLSTTILADSMKIRYGDEVLDIGTGSGVLAILAKQKGASRVLGVDKNEKAVECARKNILNNKLEERIKIIKSDLFSNVKNRKFDVILFNPPQRILKPRNKLEEACFDYKMKNIKSFLSNLRKFLRPAGRVYVGYGNAGEIEKLEKLFRKQKLKYKIINKMSFGKKMYRVYKITV